MRSGGLLEIEARRSRRPSEIAGRSRGTPRIANRLLRRVRDFASVGRRAGRRASRASGLATRSTASTSTRLGLRRARPASLLQTLLEKFDGGPVGLETLAAAVGEDKGTIEDLVEPYLIYQGFLARTPRGRVATRNAPAITSGWRPRPVLRQEHRATLCSSLSCPRAHLWVVTPRGLSMCALGKRAKRLSTLR